jgi:hypothetical protein
LTREKNKYAVEYLRLESDERKAGKENMLYAQMEVLSILQKYQKYKKLRVQELSLKTALKRYIRLLNEEIEILDKLLPHVKFERIKEEPKLNANTDKKRRSLEIQIDDIKKKIQNIQ